jgi:hypothetical protein
MKAMAWDNIENGATIGTPGSEGGVIERDEEHTDGARITVERGGDYAPYSITRGVYGWFFHTRFCSTRDEANRECDLMRVGMGAILALIPAPNDPEADEKSNRVVESIHAFVGEFP